MRPASSAERNDSRSEWEGAARSLTGVSALSPLSSCASGTFTSSVRRFHFVRGGGPGRGKVAHRYASSLKVRSRRKRAGGEPIAVRSGRHYAASKSRSLHHPSSSISRWYFEGSARRRGATGRAAAWLSACLRRLRNGAPNTAEKKQCWGGGTGGRLRTRSGLGPAPTASARLR